MKFIWIAAFAILLGSFCYAASPPARAPVPYPSCGLYKHDFLGGLLVYEKKSATDKLQILGDSSFEIKDAYWSQTALIEKFSQLKQSGECHIDLNAVKRAIDFALIDGTPYFNQVKAALDKVSEPVKIQTAPVAPPVEPEVGGEASS